MAMAVRGRCRTGRHAHQVGRCGTLRGRQQAAADAVTQRLPDHLAGRGGVHGAGAVGPGRARTRLAQHQARAMGAAQTNPAVAGAALLVVQRRAAHAPNLGLAIDHQPGAVRGCIDRQFKRPARRHIDQADAGGLAGQGSGVADVVGDVQDETVRPGFAAHVGGTRGDIEPSLLGAARQTGRQALPNPGQRRAAPQAGWSAINGGRMFNRRDW